ncbi:MAG TPA: NTF2 fold immunity protein [Burkholderiaceae bacterium]|jgi:hypothetical protein
MQLQLTPVAIAISLLALFSQATTAAPIDCKKPEQIQGYQPKNGVVSTEKTAIAIARAIIAESYGEKTMEDWKPLTATESGDDWEVVGRVRRDRSGGGVTIRISRCTGRVVFLFADK